MYTVGHQHFSLLYSGEYGNGKRIKVENIAFSNFIIIGKRICFYCPKNEIPIGMFSKHLEKNGKKTISIIEGD